jgi:CBS domain-containing protein
MRSIRVKEIMTAKPFIISPMETVKAAAKHMKKIDCGVLPVGVADKVIGIITDRDITIRVTAEGKDPSTITVQEVMTKELYTCDEKDDIEDAAEKMRKRDVSRLVVTKGKKVTGIITMACLLRSNGHRRKSNKVLHELLRPHPQKKQAAKK